MLLSLSLAAPVRRTIRVDGVERVFWAQTPSAAPPARGWPVVLSFHGWCMTATQQADDDGLRKLGASTAIVIHPEGFSDPTDCQQYDCSAWQSFNGGGSAGVESGGSDGPICEPDYVAKDGWQCYKSCEALGYCTADGGGGKCRWSHCLSDAAFVVAILKSLAAPHDAARVYSTGHSNGAMVQWGLLADPLTANVFAAVAPVAGVPHNGFNVGFAGGVQTRPRVLIVQGTHDTYVDPFTKVPGRDDKTFGKAYGWYYSSWSNTTALLAQQAGHTRPAAPLPPPGGGAAAGTFNCSGWTTANASVVDIGGCLYDGPHSAPAAAWTMVWAFFGLDAAPSSDTCTVLGCGEHGAACFCNAECEARGDCCADYGATCKGVCPSCGGYTCDEWIDWDPTKYSCAELERDFGCDCRGCMRC